MSFLEYASADLHGGSGVRDRGTPYRPNPSPGERELEEEIDRLRARMVQLFLRENSLTSESVVEISRLLDEKINQYMERRKRSR